MLRYHQLLLVQLEHFVHSLDDARVGGHSALKRHRGLQLGGRGDSALEVAYQSMTDTCHDLAGRRALLLQVDHVAFGKHTASSGHTRGVFDLCAHVAELLDRQAKTRGLLVEEATRTGRAQSVHGEVGYLTAALSIGGFQQDKLGVIASDFDDGVDLRI